MLSLDNTYSKEDLQDFDEPRRESARERGSTIISWKKRSTVFRSPLFMKTACLKLGATRGDGKNGDDITENIKTIGSIPLRIPAEGSSL